VEENEAETPNLQAIVFRIARSYVLSKLKSKYRLERKNLTGSLEEGHYWEKKGDVAREAFLAVRGRTNKEDFIEYFTGTLCAYPQRLGEADYAFLAEQLLRNPEQLRTLTLLALSANG